MIGTISHMQFSAYRAQEWLTIPCKYILATHFGRIVSPNRLLDPLTSVAAS